MSDWLKDCGIMFKMARREGGREVVCCDGEVRAKVRCQVWPDVKAIVCCLPHRLTCQPAASCYTSRSPQPRSKQGGKGRDQEGIISYRVINLLRNEETYFARSCEEEQEEQEPARLVEGSEHRLSPATLTPPPS